MSIPLYSLQSLQAFNVIDRFSMMSCGLQGYASTLKEDWNILHLVVRLAVVGANLKLGGSK